MTLLTCRNLDIDALIPAIKAIRHLAERRSTGRIAARATDLREPASPTYGIRPDGQLPYDPAVVFHLEMMVSLAVRGEKHIAETW
jgi:brefeldin A-resistance guanine nucleotide exchange factor 1